MRVTPSPVVLLLEDIFYPCYVLHISNARITVSNGWPIHRAKTNKILCHCHNGCGQNNETTGGNRGKESTSTRILLGLNLGLFLNQVFLVSLGSAF